MRREERTHPAERDGRLVSSLFGLCLQTIALVCIGYPSGEVRSQDRYCNNITMIPHAIISLARGNSVLCRVPACLFLSKNGLVEIFIRINPARCKFREQRQIQPCPISYWEFCRFMSRLVPFMGNFDPGIVYWTGQHSFNNIFNLSRSVIFNRTISSHPISFRLFFSRPHYPVLFCLIDSVQCLEIYCSFSSMFIYCYAVLSSSNRYILEFYNKSFLTRVIPSSRTVRRVILVTFRSALGV